MSQDLDLIFGTHSILACLQNEKRGEFELIACEKIEDAPLRDYVHRQKIKVQQMQKADFNMRLEKFIRAQGGEFKRPPAGVALFASKLPVHDVTSVIEDVASGKPIKIICLDQVTDIHNIGAISRTASFYGVNYIVHSLKNGIPLTPTLYRIASGAVEYVDYVYTSSLPKFIDSLQEFKFPVFGLSEDGSEEIGRQSTKVSNGFCVVMGSEDKGLSHAVKRVIKENLRLQPHGPIGTLNVSVAAAISLDRLR